MSVGEQVVWLLILALPVASIAWTVTHEEITREFREWCSTCSRRARRLLPRKLFYIFTCEYCFSHYIAAALVVATRFQLLIDGWQGYLISFFSVAAVANVYMSLFGRLRVDIRSERLEVAEKEQVVKAMTEGEGGHDALGHGPLRRSSAVRYSLAPDGAQAEEARLPAPRHRARPAMTTAALTWSAPDGTRIEEWPPDPADPAAIARDLDDLADVLRATVHAGAGVSFYLPFSIDDARRFWDEKVLPAARAGTRRVLVARDGDAIVGTVQLELTMPPNQRHRAEVMKMLVHPAARRRGIARALMKALEDVARQERRTLLTLDTVTGCAAEPLYLSLGFAAVGVIPRFARQALSEELEDATIMYKHLVTPPPRRP